MFANTFRSASHLGTPSRLERRDPGLPPQGVGKYTCRHHKARDIFGDIVWLDDVLRILLAGFSPAAQFYVQFISNFIRFPFIQGEYSQDCGRLEIGAILHNESVSAISVTAGSTTICTGP